MATNFYNILQNSQVITKTEGNQQLANLHGAAKIMNAFDLHRMTDIYGDIPYTNAGKGLEGEQNWFPVYESQKDVYDAMITDIKSARDEMSSSAQSLGVQDFLYNGDVAKWKKFANSLLMRFSLQMGENIR